MLRVSILITVLFLSGCAPDKGECVLVSGNSWNHVTPEKGEYIKFSDSSHWYTVNGEIKSILGIVSSVTSCTD